MNRKERGLTDIVHAWLHTHKERLAYPGKMKVNDFIKYNKGVIKAIYDQLRQEYNMERNKMLDACFVQGVTEYLKAEKLLLV